MIGKASMVGLGAVTGGAVGGIAAATGSVGRRTMGWGATKIKGSKAYARANTAATQNLSDRKGFGKVGGAFSKVGGIAATKLTNVASKGTYQMQNIPGVKKGLSHLGGIKGLSSFTKTAGALAGAGAAKKSYADTKDAKIKKKKGK